MRRSFTSTPRLSPWRTNTRAIFTRNGARSFRELKEMNFDAMIVSPFDAELFGHWWFEGPHFLESFIRRAATEPDDFQLTTPTEFLDRAPVATDRAAKSLQLGRGRIQCRLARQEQRLDLPGTACRHSPHDGDRPPPARFRRAHRRARAPASRARASPRPIERLGFPDQKRRARPSTRPQRTKIISGVSHGSTNRSARSRSSSIFLANAKSALTFFPTSTGDITCSNLYRMNRDGRSRAWICGSMSLRGDALPCLQDDAGRRSVSV